MKKKSILIVLCILGIFHLNGQNPDSTGMNYLNSADLMLKSNSKLGIGGYGEVHYNQPLSKNQKELGTLDVHRMVMFLGYNFSDKTQFVSEIEYEHAKELWVEQAFLQHKISRSVNLRAGLLLIPIGIVNEYHEPTTFNGVERPVIDNRLGLSTWREVGIGLSGNLLPLTLKYQLYVVGGLNGYDSKAVFNGANGLREGRQKGSKAYVSSPALTGKVEYYGLRNLNFGLSGYLGKSQSKLYGKLPNDNTAMLTRADSSSVGIAIIGADARFKHKGLEMRGQIYYTAISNTLEYNRFTRTGNTNNDLGKSMIGYYFETGYNIFRLFENIDQELIPFIRYEFYNTHSSVDATTTVKPVYKNTIVTAGLTFRLTEKAALKSDLQFSKSAASDEFSKTFNAGIAFMF